MLRIEFAKLTASKIFDMLPAFYRYLRSCKPEVLLGIGARFGKWTRSARDICECADDARSGLENKAGVGPGQNDLVVGFLNGEIRMDAGGILDRGIVVIAIGILRGPGNQYVPGTVHGDCIARIKAVAQPVIAVGP